MKNLGGQVFAKAKEGVLGRVGEEEEEKVCRKQTKVKPKKLSRTNSKDKLIGAENLEKTEALVKAPKAASKERVEGTKIVGEASDSGVASDNSATSSEFAVPNSLPRYDNPLFLFLKKYSVKAIFLAVLALG